MHHHSRYLLPSLTLPTLNYSLSFVLLSDFYHRLLVLRKFKSQCIHPTWTAIRINPLFLLLLLVSSNSFVPPPVFLLFYFLFIFGLSLILNNRQQLRIAYSHWAPSLSGSYKNRILFFNTFLFLFYPCCSSSFSF